jgi:phytoene synthase
VYLPRDELQRFDYSADDLRAGVQDDRFRELMRFQVARARSYYARSLELYSLLKPPGRPVFSAMVAIYGRLLATIEERDYDVFSQRVHLSARTKLAIAVRHLLRPAQRPVLP